MIFVTVGSQKFQFNRLLQELEHLVEKGKINPKKIFAQTGYSDYQPIHYSYEKFLNKEQFEETIHKSEIIITHGGIGTIISAIKKEKKVIGISRSSKYGEHVDNHQFEIIEQFSNANMIIGMNEVSQLEPALMKIRTQKFEKYYSNTGNIIDTIKYFLA